MKEWNTPSVEELNVTETASGIFNADLETVILFNDNFKSNTPDNEDEKKDPATQLS